MNTEKTLLILSLIGKLAGVAVMLQTLPGLDPKIGLIIFAGASILKDAVNRIGDAIDNGKMDGSFKG